jgi:TIR domain
MPSVFLSYSPDDAPVIEQLEAQLKQYPEISIWRDQERVCREPKWQQALGKVISEKDMLFLTWSKHAATSTYVTFEWQTALALKKPIILSLLDNTPLPSSLTEFPSYHATNLEGIVRALRASIQKRPTVAPVEILSLEQPAPSKTKSPIDIDTLAPTVIAQDNAQKTQPSFIDRWQNQVTFIAGVATVITAVVAMWPDLSRKVGFTALEDDDQVVEQILAGSVQDDKTNALLDRADVMLPEFGLMSTTNPSGYFELRVRAPKQEIVSVSARREGYAPSEIQRRILGDRKVVILLKRKKS